MAGDLSRCVPLVGHFVPILLRFVPTFTPFCPDSSILSRACHAPMGDVGHFGPKRHLLRVFSAFYTTLVQLSISKGLVRLSKNCGESMGLKSFRWGIYSR